MLKYPYLHSLHLILYSNKPTSNSPNGVDIIFKNCIKIAGKLRTLTKKRGFKMLSNLNWYPNDLTLSVKGDQDHSNFGQTQCLPSSLSHMHIKCLRDHKVMYPKNVLDALYQIYLESNQYLSKRYPYCRDDNGKPISHWLQIDIQGLSTAFLTEAEHCSQECILHALRPYIHGINNIVDVHPTFEQNVSNESSCKTFRDSLDFLRQKFGMPIARLATTDFEFQEICRNDLRLSSLQQPTDHAVKGITGFDAILNPSQFVNHLRSNKGTSKYLLYVKKPTYYYDSCDSLLLDRDIRRAIRQHSLTQEIHHPFLAHEKYHQQNTRLMMSMGVGMLCRSAKDLFTDEFLLTQTWGVRADELIEDLGIDVLKSEFKTYLINHHTQPESVVRGMKKILATPIFDGRKKMCMSFSKDVHIKKLLSSFRTYGEHMLQTYNPLSTLVNSDTGISYQYFDRIFMCLKEGKPSFMYGLRPFIPLLTNIQDVVHIYNDHQVIWCKILPKTR